MIDLQALFSTGLSPVNAEQVALALLLAFVLGKVIAVVYEWTYEGLSFTRSFAQALVLSPLVATILMLAIGDNLARGLGILGTMALVRFRTNVRDVRDMVFVFAALATGVAVGVRAWPVATVGCLAFCAASVALGWAPLGARQHFDGVLRFWLPRESVDAERIKALIEPHCRRFVLVALRDLAQGEALEYAYQVRLRDPHGQARLVNDLEQLPGIGGLTLLLQDAEGQP